MRTCLFIPVLLLLVFVAAAKIETADLGPFIAEFDIGNTAGEHQIALDTADLPAGLYFLRLEAAGKVRVAKAVVIK